MVIYDRACKLHTYALKREPYFFKDTLFWVDAQHITGHVGCSEGYDPRVFRNKRMHASAARMPLLNTEIAEQCNAALKLIRTPAAFMTLDRFMQYTRTFLALWNIRKASDMARRPASYSKSRKGGVMSL